MHELAGRPVPGLCGLDIADQVDGHAGSWLTCSRSMGLWWRS